MTRDDALRRLEYFRSAILSLPKGAKIKSFFGHCDSMKDRILLDEAGETPFPYLISTYKNGTVVEQAAKYGVEVKWCFVKKDGGAVDGQKASS